MTAPSDQSHGHTPGDQREALMAKGPVWEQWRTEGNMCHVMPLVMSQDVLLHPRISAGQHSFLQGQCVPVQLRCC